MCIALKPAHRAQQLAVVRALATERKKRTDHIATIARCQLLGVAYAHQLPIYKDSQAVTQHLHMTASFGKTANLQLWNQRSASLEETAS